MAGFWRRRPAVPAVPVTVPGQAGPAGSAVPGPVQEPPAGGHVFISYSHAPQDRAYVDRLARHLDGQGVPVWYDQALSAGQAWPVTIEQAITTCAAFVVVMTPAAGASQWVAREIRHAANSGRPVLPLLLDGAPIFELNHLQAEPVPGGAMPSPAFVERLKALTGGPARPVPAQWSIRVWKMQTPDPTATARPVLAESLIDKLTTTPGATVAIGTTAALFGVGGFGKTTLARQVCADPRVRAHFHDGLWITVGEETTGPSLAQKINDLVWQLTGERPAITDPDQAGLHLGAVLDQRTNVLLVIDDAWTIEQLTPLLHGDATTTTRLITTRRPHILPPAARNGAVEVDQLTDGQARELLAYGLPALVRTDLTALVKLTGRWPLLVQLAHGFLATNLDSNRPQRTVDELVTALRRSGPTVLDIVDETSRTQAVTASIEASLGRLTQQQRQRFLDLGVFAEDTLIPTELTALLWGHTGRIDRPYVDKLVSLVTDLGLVADRTAAGLRLHDVIRAYLHTVASTTLPSRHGALVDATRQAFGAWWGLPDTAAGDYLRTHLTEHLAEARRDEELAALVTDLRWVEHQLRHGGPAAINTDLARTTDPTATALRQVLGQNPHLLAPLEPPQALADTLVSRLIDTPELRPLVDAYTATMRAVVRLQPRWPMPDQPDPALRLVLAGHTGPVVSCAVAPDGSWLVTTSDDGTARIWDPVTGQLRHTLAGHTDYVESCVVAPDGLWLVATSRERIARIWDSTTGQVRHTLAGHTGTVVSCAAAPDGSWLVTTSQDRTARIWDTTTGHLRHTLSGHTGPVVSCAVAPDGSWLVTTSDDGTAQVWDPVTGRLRFRNPLAGHTDSVVSCAVAPDGSWLVTTSLDGTARVWDALTGQVRHVLAEHTGPVVSCAVAPDGSWLVTIGDDRIVRTWDAVTGQVQHVLTGHTDWVVSCAVAPDGSWLVTTSRDGTARIWDPVSGELRRVLTGHTGPVVSCAVAPDGTWLVITSVDRTARVWDALPGQVRTPVELVGPVESCAVAPDGSWLVTTSVDRTARVWDAVTGQARHVLTGHTGPVESCAVAPDGSWLVTTGGHVTARVWDAATGRLRHVLDGRATMHSCAVAPDGSWLVTAGGSWTALIWDAVAGQLRHSLASHGGPVESCAVAPDGTWLVTTSRDRTARIWDAATGRGRHTLDSHSGPVVSCAVAADGSWLVTTSYDRTARVWDAATGRVRHTLVGHGGPVVSCAVAPDGSWLVTTSHDATARVWDAATGRVRHTLVGHTGPVLSCAVAPNGSWLVTTSRDGTARVWDPGTGVTVTALRVTRALNLCTWLPDSSALVVAGQAGAYLFDLVRPASALA